MSRLQFFMNKREHINKSKKWHFVVVLDSKDQCLKDRVPDVEEHYARILDLFGDFPASHYALRSAFKAGVPSKLPFYFICPDAHLLPRLLHYDQRPIKPFAGRIMDTNTHVISSFDSMINRTEFIERGFQHVIIYGGAKELNSMLPFIDQIHITRVDGDFTIMLPEDEIEDETFDFERAQSYGIRIKKMIESEKSKEMQQIKKSTIKDMHEEHLSDHIKITYSNKTLKEKQRLLPGITTYGFEDLIWSNGRFLDGWKDPFEGLKGKKRRAAEVAAYEDDQAWFYKLQTNLNEQVQRGFFATPR